MSLLASDASSRLATLKRARSRSQQAFACESRAASALAPAAASAENPAASVSAAEMCVRSAAARLHRTVDDATEEEIGRIENWLLSLDGLAMQCQTDAAEVDLMRFLARSGPCLPG